MLKRLQAPSPATTIACLALFFAVAGGSAIALQGRNSVNSGDIKPKAVKTSDIANNAVTTKQDQEQRRPRGRHPERRGWFWRDPQRSGARRGRRQPGGLPGGRAAQVSRPSTTARRGTASGRMPRCAAPDQLTPRSIRTRWGGCTSAELPRPPTVPVGMPMCGGAGDEGVEDGYAFILPEAYRPANDELRANAAGGGGTILIIGSTPIVTPGATFPAGAVFDLSSVGRGAARRAGFPRGEHRQRLHPPRLTPRRRAAGQHRRDSRRLAAGE